MGPHRIFWEVSQEDEEETFVRSLRLPEGVSNLINASDVVLPRSSGPSISLASWFERQRLLAGRLSFTAAEITEQARLCHQRCRSYRRLPAPGVRALTVHQAKNREFDSVIVLWPYEVQGSDARLRRLLYNAITRARRAAVVIVQNPARLSLPPFSVR